MQQNQIVTAKMLWWLFAAAMASSLPTLGYYLIGEEGILVNSSLEMAQRGEWRRIWLFGLSVLHGVFANWLVIIVSNVVGWEHSPAVVRGIMIASTAATGLMLAWLAYRLTRDAVLAALAGVIVVTFADVLLYRGWLGYRDPLLMMLVFGAILSLWVAVDTRNTAWLTGTLVFASLAFLTKGIIAYSYVGVAAFVFLCQREPRAFLLRPIPVLLAVATLCVPALWSYGLTGGQQYNQNLGAEIGSKLALPGMGAYLTKLLSYPFETLARLLPVPLLVLWYAWRGKTWPLLLKTPRARTAAAISILGFVPFWFAPQGHFRYLLPLLPAIALWLACAVRELEPPSVRTIVRWLWALVVIKIALAVIAFPIYQQKFRGENYAVAAKDIARIAGGYPLYTTDVASAGLSVTAYLNIQRLGKPALTFPPKQWSDGLILTPVETTELGKTVATYPLAGDTLYLMCRGTACSRLTKP